MRKIHNNKKIKGSLGREIMVAFASVLFVTVFLCWLINTFFLERIYIDKKEKSVKTVYTEMYKACMSGEMSSDEFDLKLQTYAVIDNVSISIMTSLFKPIRIYSTESQERLAEEMVSNLSGPVKVDEIIEESSDYVLVRKNDRRTGVDNIEMWGNLPDGSFFLLRTALESVHQSALLASKVSLIVGLCAAVVGSLFIYLFSRRFSKPVLELADIAEKMSNMDFEASYTGSSNNEIQVLGDSINKMSANLSDAISELKSANIELEKDIAKKTEIDNMRTEFISNITHELKTPLAIIQGYAEGLKDGVGDASDRDYYCDVIIDESNKMNHMVKQIIDLNKLETGGLKLQIERFDLSVLINNYVQKSDIIIKNNNIKVTAPSEPMFVWADEFMIEEVIMNYFTNAINHCEAEGEKQISIYYEKEDNHVKVNIFNTGDCIPEESLDRVFEKFYKVDKARSRQYGGSGIGLSVVKAIVEAHNEKCGVKNVDSGVVFWFTADTEN